MFETAATVLEKVLAKDNGPYVLITWTSKSDQHEQLMAHFAGIEELPTPVVSGSLAKEKFTSSNTDGEAADRPARSLLAEEIRKILGTHPQIDALMHWEAAARRATGEVICSLMDLLPRRDRFLGSTGPTLEYLLTHIAGAAVGKRNVASDRRGAISEALTPILYDRLVHQAANEAETDAWASAMSLGGGLPKLVPDPGPKLNALSHIAMPGSGVMSAGDRGVAFQLAGGTLGWFSRKAGITPEQLSGEFLRAGERGEGTSPVNTDLTDCRWVLLGTRAVCDQAQSRGTLRPAVLAVEVPGSLKDDGAGLRVRRHGASLVTPAYEVADESGTGQLRKLVINWHWTTSLGLPEMTDAAVLFRMREPLINMLSASWSGYSARPGIIQF
ncbi:hypothetical protein MMR14E_18815 [Methylobacterium mesophilicum]